MEPDLVYVAHGSPPYWKAVVLRQQELRDPLGMVFSYEELEAEADQIHLVLMAAAEVVGSVSLQFQGEVAKVRQMVVAPGHRGRGLGAKLLTGAEKEVLRQGYHRILLHARSRARGFYETQGYTAISDEFLEVGLPHVAMEKALGPSP